MKKGTTILLLGLLLGTAAFTGSYYAGTASCRNMMLQPEPELAWLKKEFKLSDAEFARIVRLHEAYLPQCGTRCRRIEEQNRELRQLFTHATNMTPDIQNLFAERANLRAECEGEMMKHFLEVSRTMAPDQGRRYLSWVEEQTFLRGESMEQRHQTSGDLPTTHAHQK